MGTDLLLKVDLSFCSAPLRVLNEVACMHLCINRVKRACYLILSSRFGISGGSEISPYFESTCHNIPCGALQSGRIFPLPLAHLLLEFSEPS